MFDYFDLVGQRVDVLTDGICYTGRFIEMNEEEIHLESDTGWLTIRLDRVSEVRRADR